MESIETASAAADATGQGSAAATDVDGAPSRERILRSARAAIEATGVLGLRVGQVAAEANTSLTLIYKYFESRDGLLAQVLGDMFEEFVSEDMSRVEQMLSALGDRKVTTREVVAFVPMPTDPGREHQRWLRIQILAASREIPQLRRRLEQIQTRVDARMRDLLADVMRRLDRVEGPSVKVMSLLFQAMPLGYVFNDLLGEDRVTRDELHEFYVGLFTR